MSNRNYNNSTGIGFVGLLQILFIALKLTNIIAWSWLWVLSPMWIGVLMIITVILLMIYLFNSK